MAIPEGKSADRPKATPTPRYVTGATGEVFSAADDQHESQLVDNAGATAIGPDEAHALAKAQQDSSYVDRNWGVAGKAGMGAFSGLTLGIGPGMLAQGGLVDPGHLQAAQESGYYTAGDVAGTMLPALVSGGGAVGARGAVGSALRFTPAGVLEMAGSGTERLLGGILGESTGVLGRLGLAPLKMAARGATEGALINMGHTTGDAMIQNKPLSAEALASSGVDGALFGGLIGGTLGTVGSLSSMAADSVSSLAKNAVGRSGVREGLVFKRLGLSAEDAIDAGAAEGGRVGFLKDTGEILEKGGSGAKIGSSDAKLAEGLTAGRKVVEAERVATVKQFDEAAGPLSPSLERMSGRFETEISMPRWGTANEAQTQRIVEKLKAELQPIQPRAGIEPVEVAPKTTQDYHVGKDGKSGSYKPREVEPGYKIPGVDWETPGTWAKWIETRDQLAAGLKGVRGSNPLLATETQIRKEALHIIDSEIRAAMEGAAKTPGLEGLAEKYGASTKLLTVAEKLEETVGKKAADKLLSTGSSITGTDIGYAIGGSMMGHPATAIGWLASKGIVRKLEPLIEPAMAQMAYDATVGVKAANATRTIQNKIAGTVSKFFKDAMKVPGTAAKVDYAAKSTASKRSYKGTDRKAYEESASRMEQLTSANHQDKIRRYAEGLHDIGYMDYAKAIMDTNNRAVQYILYNLPARQAAKQMNSLRPIPASKVPSFQEYKAHRIISGIQRGIPGLLEDMEKGTLSRDAVKAVKYVYPELHKEFVGQVAQNIYQMKSEGKTLPMSKIAMIGTALDAPVDSTLTAEYIGHVQTALNAPPPQDQSQPPPTTQGPSPMSQALMTPNQKMMAS